MDFMTIFWIVWIIVLPILAIAFVFIIPVFWFFIVPKVARMLTWKRFAKVSFHMVADDTGYAMLLPTKEELPEGVVKTKLGYRFLPQVAAEGNSTEIDPKIQALLLRKFIWKDMGKPIWFGHAGHVASVNPTTLAIAQQSSDQNHKIKEAGNPKATLQKLENYVKKLPRTFTFGRFLGGQKTFNLRSDLTKMLQDLDNQIHRKTYTVLDPTKVPQIHDLLYTPSQLDALAENRERYGMKKMGKQYGTLFLGGGVLISLMIIGIIAILALT